MIVINKRSCRFVNVIDLLKSEDLLPTRQILNDAISRLEQPQEDQYADQQAFPLMRVKDISCEPESREIGQEFEKVYHGGMGINADSQCRSALVNQGLEAGPVRTQMGDPACGQRNNLENHQQDEEERPDW